MKRIKSIYFLFLFFCVMILVSFLILYRFSTTSLKDSLNSIAQIQMEHSGTLIDQKIKEIEIEADGILYSDNLKELQLTLTGRYDVYNYVINVNAMKEYLKSRQKSNVGMAEFTLYWPGSGRIVSTSAAANVEKEMLKMPEDSKWYLYHNEIYFSRRYRTGWSSQDDEPYLIIRMDRDYLYKLKSMTVGMGSGGMLLIQEDGSSIFSASREEQELLDQIGQQKGAGAAYALTTGFGKYQILESDTLKNGLRAVCYYPVTEMMRPVIGITRVTGIFLMVLMLVGTVFMVLYYKNILLQLKIITEHLQRVEGGDLDTRIAERPDNEFSYVFEQFNRMLGRIRQLIASRMTEQDLRHKAELRQLQLQINPHFLYNSLSYIVTVADQPEAVTEMAVHLANYYRHCTRSESVTTIGEEVSYAGAYLAIMAMRRKIEYRINVPEKLYRKPIIPLILQPIIENAIQHGIEEREEAKHIFLEAYEISEDEIRFEISDDGEGMTQEERDRLKQRLCRRQREEGESVGLWNVNQRLLNYYDQSTGLEFAESGWGGLTVGFTIKTDRRSADDSSDC